MRHHSRCFHSYASLTLKAIEQNVQLIQAAQES
jgi:hypothetical protein